MKNISFSPTRQTLILIFTISILTAFPGNGIKAQDIIPQPNKIQSLQGSFELQKNTTIVAGDFPDLADYLQKHLENGYGFRLDVMEQAHRSENTISLTRNATFPEDGYKLTITPFGINIEAAGRGGMFYGLQSLLQLMPAQVYAGGPDLGNNGGSSGSRSVNQNTGNLSRTIPCMVIEDAPMYPHRGVMLDVARTFFDKETVMRYIDWMSRHKLNIFHWHLTDDDGWRIEIKKYPELTAKGAWRGPDEALPPFYGSGQKRYGGYFTQDEVREVVAYAAYRNITIIPEIELPGHSKAAIAAYPEIFCQVSKRSGVMYSDNVWCTGREENFAMLRDIFTELADLFPGEYIHLGGDEVSTRYWKACPRCQARMRKEGISNVNGLLGYFTGRIETILDSLGKKAVAWNEILNHDHKPEKTTMITGWEGVDACRKVLRAGYDLIAMPGAYLYIDQKQGPNERGHTWAGTVVDTRRVYSFNPQVYAQNAEQSAHLKGIQGAQFTELMDRPPYFLEYQGYPRICAVAEVGWTKSENKDWDDFQRRLIGSHFPRLSEMGIRFRVPPPDVEYSNGTITAHSVIPHTEIWYKILPDTVPENWQRYTSPLADRHPERYLFQSRYELGQSASASTQATHLGIDGSWQPVGGDFNGTHSPSIQPSISKAVNFAPRERKTISIPLDGHADQNGTWVLSVIPYLENTQINTLLIQKEDTVYNTIIKSGQRANPFGSIRVQLTDKNRRGELRATISNNNDTPSRVLLTLRPSPYIEPKVSVSSSLSFTSKFPVSNLYDYNMLTYARTEGMCKAGDHVTYTFEKAISCSAIEVQTGLPNITRYIVSQGTLEYTTDGTRFMECAVFDDNGRAIFYPTGRVKAVRIKINGPNAESQLALQDLRIYRRYGDTEVPTGTPNELD